MRECKGQGVANLAAGPMGGMAGCAMIGQAVINVKPGGRGRLSTLSAGVFQLVIVVFLGDWVARIPMAALVEVMIMVSIGTFSWTSLRNLARHPPRSSAVTVATVLVVVFTHDLAKGVLVGVLLRGVFFARKGGSGMRVDAKVSDVVEPGSDLSEAVLGGRHRTDTITVHVFFASAEAFVASLDFKEAPETVRIDATRAALWDITAVGALDRVVIKFRREGTAVELVGLNAASARLVERFGLHHQPGALEAAPGH